MKVGIFAITPAQIHFYKNIIDQLEGEGHEVFILARDYGDTLELLEEMKIPYHLFSRPPASKAGKVLGFPKELLDAFLALHRWGADIVTGFGMYEAFISAVLRIPCVAFTDSEYSVNSKSYVIQFKLASPFLDAVVTPKKYKDNLGFKHIKVNSYKELAYLHQRYYVPNKDIYGMLGIPEFDEYVLLRFNAFDAVHDYGITGFGENDKIELTSVLSKYAHVFISSEMVLPHDLDKYQLHVQKNRIHDVLYYAKLLVTDTQTMTTEAALLGTPAVRCNAFVGIHDMSNFEELEHDYGLIYNFRDPQEAINKADELMKMNDLKERWAEKRQMMLSEKEDVCSAFVNILDETYLNSKKFRG